jgi:hypothetical protein
MASPLFMGVLDARDIALATERFSGGLVPAISNSKGPLFEYMITDSMHFRRRPGQDEQGIQVMMIVVQKY